MYETETTRIIWSDIIPLLIFEMRCRLNKEPFPPISFSLPRKKYEIATDEPNTPIKQDTKKGKLREVNDDYDN